jgi:hypothetical protein
VRSKGEEHREAAIMAPEKEGGRTRRKAGAGRGASERIGRTAEKTAGQSGDVTMVDVDPWGSFFERFWEQAGGEDAGRHEPAKGVRTPGAKPARRGRPPRAS